MKRYVWYSDTHLNLSVLPLLKRRFIERLNCAGVDGAFITGDISSGLWLESDLKFLAQHSNVPIYFVLGNHDYHHRNVASVHCDVRRLCQQHDNLRWLTQERVITLADDVALIGVEGWYDAMLGDPRLLRWTTDWFMTFDFLHITDMDARIQAWQRMAQESADALAGKLEQALENHKTVYVLTHFPPWKEATRAEGTWTEKFWLPYNANTAMGHAIERVMVNRKKKHVVVLAGHTHIPCQVRVSNTIQCMVARATYFGDVYPEQTIVL